MTDPDPAPLHVGLFAPALPAKGLSNGIVTYVRILRDALRSLGHQVSVVDADQIELADGSIADLPRSSGINNRLQTYTEAWRGRDLSTAYVRLRILCGFEALKADGAQIVEIEESWGWAGRLPGRGLPVVMRLHGPHAFAREATQRSRVDRRREAAEARAFSAVQAITSPSETVLRAMIEACGDRPLTKVIYNPVPVPSAQWDRSQADPDRMIFVGRFDLLKGADVVVDAFAKAVEQRPTLKLRIVGPDRGLGGTVHFDEFVARLTPAARSRIEFCGEQPPSRVAELRAESTLAIVGSRYETFPYTAFEAQAVGMPLLITDTLGPRGIVTDGLDGRLVPVADADAMAGAMIEMMADPSLLDRMGAAGRALVAKTMDPMHVARQTAHLYADTLAAFDRDR